MLSRHIKLQTSHISTVIALMTFMILWGILSERLEAQTWWTSCGRSLNEEMRCQTSKSEAALNGASGTLQSWKLPNGQTWQVFYSHRGGPVICGSSGMGMMRGRVGTRSPWIPICARAEHSEAYVYRVSSTGKVFFWGNLSDW